MRVNYILDEDFVNYKKPSMFIGTIRCDGKCYKELNLPCDICQNHQLTSLEVIDIPDEDLCRRYLENKITNAIVFGGLEPFDQFDEVKALIDILRSKHKCNDDVVIYTGYYWSEVEDKVNELRNYKNIIIKFGRYLPDGNSIYDPVLGIHLASDNQSAVIFNKE